VDANYFRVEDRDQQTSSVEAYLTQHNVRISRARSRGTSSMLKPYRSIKTVL